MFKKIFSCIVVFSFSSLYSFISNVDCQQYALDQLDNFESHFGCIEDSATYNLVFSQLEMWCEAMDV